MGINEMGLRNAVLSFVNEARANPSASVGPELDRLAQVANDSGAADAVAVSGRVANMTWMSRALLLPTQLDSIQQPIEIPYPCTIVGVLPTILLLDTGGATIEPPPEAIDVFLQIDRNETLTATTDRMTSALQDPQVVNLPALDPRIGLRLMELHLGNKMNTVSVRFRWAVPLATVAAKTWGSVQISLNWYVKPDRATV